MDDKIKQLKDIIDESENIVFFGGAGVSTASGIPDFRSADGVYNQKLNRNLNPEELVSHSYFQHYPEDFFDFYKEKLVYPDAEPNNCHLGLAKLEEEGKLKAIVTQNIDGLHQKAGSKNVYELHGSTERNYCTNCGKTFDADYVLNADGVPICDVCGGVVRPDVVLYEEALDPNVINSAVNAIQNADTLIVGGTSLVVYPAAGLIDFFRGKNLVLINKGETIADNKADLVINDDIAKVIGEATGIE